MLARERAAHAQRLAGYLHRALDRIPGARIHSPRDLNQTTGIVTFSLDGIPGTDIAPALRDRWNILTRPALNGTSVRAAITCFTVEADLDLLAEAVATIRREA